MEKFNITEQEKKDILHQHDKVNSKERRTLDVNLQSSDFIHLNSQGLTPYYFDSDLGSMVELTKPVKNDYQTKPKEVFLLTSDEYNTIKKMSDNINEMIKLKLDEIELYKQYVLAVANELVKKNK